MKIWNKFLSKHFRKKGYKKEYLKLRLAEYSKNLRIALFIFAFFLVGLNIIIYSPYIEVVEKNVRNIYFGKIASIYESNTIVISIAEVCKNFDKEEK